jgi:hypothetical protein
MTTDNILVIRVPAEFTDEFLMVWNALAIVEKEDRKLVADDLAIARRADAASIAQAMVPLLQASAPIVTGVLGYLVARRGEVEIVLNGNTYKFKQLSGDEIKTVLQLIKSATL